MKVWSINSYGGWNSFSPWFLKIIFIMNWEVFRKKNAQQTSEIFYEMLKVNQVFGPIKFKLRSNIVRVWWVVPRLFLWYVNYLII